MTCKRITAKLRSFSDHDHCRQNCICQPWPQAAVQFHYQSLDPESFSDGYCRYKPRPKLFAHIRCRSLGDVITPVNFNVGNESFLVIDSQITSAPVLDAFHRNAGIPTEQIPPNSSSD
jgi:hypothetical protein